MWGEKIKPQILLGQNKYVNLDGHIIVRGLLTKRSTIARLEDEVSGKLIPDSKPDLLKILDELAEYVRVRNGGYHTPKRTLEFMSERYVHRDLIISEDVFQFQWKIDFKLGDVNVGGTKKMWFQLPMSFQINRSKRG